MKTLALCLALALSGVALADPPQCWRNDAGVTECGKRPPPGVDARSVVAPRPATQEAAEESVETAEAFAEADLDGEEASRRAILLQHCNLARETLNAYNRSEFLYERDATGNRRVLDEQETAAAKAKAQQDVTDRCAAFPETAP